MKRLVIIILLFAAIKVAGQTTGYLRFDTVRIFKQNGTCELYIQNKTKDSTGGVLTNIGNGLTRFVPTRQVSDSIFIGGDTVVISHKLDSIHVYVASGTSPDTIYQYKNGDSSRVGFIPKGDGVGINIYNADSTISSNRTITQSGRYLKFLDGITYTQFEGGKETIQPDSTAPYTYFQINSPYVGSPTAGLLNWYQHIGKADQSPEKPNVINIGGWNLAAGGGVVMNGLPAMGWSWESHYLPDPLTPGLWLMEYHIFYITPQGKQIRVASYTINTNTNFIDFYQTLGNWRLVDTASQAWLASSKDIANKTAQLFLLSTESGHGLAITADSINGVLNFQPANSFSTTSFMADQWANVNLPGHYFDATGFTTPGHIGEFNILGNSSKAVVNFKRLGNIRGAIYTDDADGFMHQQVQATWGFRWIVDASEKMRLYPSGSFMLGTTGVSSANEYQRKLFINGSIGANKDSISKVTPSGVHEMLVLDTTTGRFHRADVPAGGGGGGSVTSVALSMPTGLSVGGSPVTTSGTLAVTTTLNGIVTGDGSGLAAVTTSAGISSIISNETGTGVMVFGTQPVFTTDITAPLIYGSSSSGGNLTLGSTSHATKGKILFGSSAYDEVNNYFGQNITSPTARFHLSVNGIGSTPADANGILLSNTTAAAAGAQQEAPTVTFDGQGWKTNATAASQSTKLRLRFVPVQGAAAPTWQLLFQSSINGGAYSNPFNMTSDGTFTASGQLTATTHLALGGAGQIIWSSSNRISSPSNGVMTLLNSAQTDFTRLQFGGTTSSFPSLARSSANLIAKLADNSANTDIEVLDEAYDATNWNSSNEVPTKNAVRDKIEAMNVTNGTYAVTITNGANVDATTVPGTNWYYSRIGNQVTVWGMLEVDPTATATSTVVSFSLPIASALTQYYQLSGQATGNVLTGAYFGGFIQGDATNDRAQLDFTSATTVNAVWSIRFTYEVL